MHLEELKDFRLAGGTALSLRLGHRISVDLDLFTNKIFEVSKFTTYLKIFFKERIQINGSNKYGVFAAIDNIKVDLLYRYESFINNVETYDHIRLAPLEDLSAMKINAAVDRGSKKDYYDLFELLKVYAFADLIKFYSKMYPNYGPAATLKSLCNFQDSDLEEDPISLNSSEWVVIKDKISKEIKNYIFALKQKEINAEQERLKSIKGIISKRENKNNGC